MSLCVGCPHCSPIVSDDLSVQARAKCDIHPEYGMFILYGNGCEEAI